MKTIAKKIIPAFAVMAAVVGAFAFEKADTKSMSPEFGWINLPGQPCHVQVQCDNRPTGPLCTAVYLGDSYQARGKSDPLVNICDKTLRMPLN